jgi:uncharacterized protein (DUF433 family)
VKICVIGNSHAAALKSALAVDDSAVGVGIDFFVMPGGSGLHVHAEGGRLLPAPFVKGKVFSTIPSAVEDGLDLGEFDTVMICAAGLPSYRNGDADHILNQLALGSLVHDLNSKRQIVSEGVMAAAVENVLHASPTLQAIRLIRSIFSGRVLIQGCPLPTRALVGYRLDGEKVSNLASQYGDRVWLFLSWYYRQQIRLIRAFADTLDARVMSPDDSFVDAGFTPTK